MEPGRAPDRADAELVAAWGAAAMTTLTHGEAHCRAKAFLAAYSVGEALFNDYKTTQDHFAALFGAAPSLLVARLSDPMQTPFTGRFPPGAAEVAAWLKTETARIEYRIRAAKEALEAREPPAQQAPTPEEIERRKARAAAASERIAQIFREVPAQPQTALRPVEARDASVYDPTRPAPAPSEALKALAARQASRGGWG